MSAYIQRCTDDHRYDVKIAWMHGWMGMNKFTKVRLVQEWTKSVEDDILVAVRGGQEDLVACLELACLLDDTVVKDLSSGGGSSRHFFLEGWLLGSLCGSSGSGGGEEEVVVA